jgi:hypothetical protein
MRIIDKRLLTAAAITCPAAACFGGLAPMAQATGPGTGQGLVPLPLPPGMTVACADLATGVTYTDMVFLVPGAQKAANRGTGAMNAPFPGFLVSYTAPAGAPPIPTGTWQLLAFPTPGRQIGHKEGLEGDAFDCGSAPTGQGL